MGNQRNISFRYVALFLIASVAFYLAVFHLGKTSYHNDELALLFHQSLPISRLIEFCLNWGYHPPLYFFLLKAWMSVDGGEEFFSRFLSVIFFVFMTVLPYWYKKILSFPWWQFSLLLALSYPVLSLSRMVEPYSLASLLCLASWLQILRWQDSANKKDSALLILALTLCFYTHYLAWAFCLIFCALFFFQLLMKKETGKWRIFLALGAIHFLTILPWILYNLSFKSLLLATNSFWNPPNSIFSSSKEVVLFLFSNELFLILLWSVVVLMNIFGPKKNKLIALIVLWLGLFYLALVYRSLGAHSYLIPRYFLWMVPVLYFIFLTSLPRKGSLILFGLFILFQLKALPRMYEVTWSEVRNPFIFTAMQGQGMRCDKEVAVAWYNSQIYRPYVKKYGRCGIELINEDICLNSLDSLLKNLSHHKLIIFHENFCPELFNGLLLLNPEYAGTIFFKTYRLLILGQSRESFIEEINSVPGLNFSFREEIPRGNYVQ